MADVPSREELRDLVDARYRWQNADAPEGRLQPGTPNYATLRERWLKACEEIVNEETNRVFWDRWPEAPKKLDGTSPEDEEHRTHWWDIHEQVLGHRPDPEDANDEVGLGEYDFSYLRADIYEKLVDYLPDIDPSLHDEVKEAVEAALLYTEGSAKDGSLTGDGGSDIWESAKWEVGEPYSEQRPGAIIMIQAWWDGALPRGFLSLMNNRINT